MYNWNFKKKGEGKRAGKIFEDRMVKYPEKYYESIKYFSILLKKRSINYRFENFSKLPTV